MFTKKLGKYAVIIITAYLIITQIVPWGLKLNMYGASKFDHELWVKESEVVEIGPSKISDKTYTVKSYRCGMYNDLTKNHLKKGMKLKEVTDILGDYRLVYYCTNKKAKCIAYALGSCLNGVLNKSLMVVYFGHYDRQYMYVCFDGNEELISSGKSFGEKIYPYLVCEGKDNTVACGKYSGECTKAPRISSTDRVIYDEVEFEQW